MLLGLLFCNVGFSYELKRVVESLRCYTTSLWILTLDIDKEDNTYGSVLNYNTYNGEKKPELTLVITAEEVDAISWKGEVLLVNHFGKEEYKLTNIEMPRSNFKELHAGQIKSNGDVRGLRLTKQITFNSKYDDDDTKEDIYYDLELTYFSNMKSLNNKKKIFASSGFNQFHTFSETLVCLK